MEHDLRVAKVISGADDIRHILQGPIPAAVTLANSKLSANEKAEWQTRLERHINACGCEFGSGALIIAIVPVAFWLWSLSERLIWDWAIALGILAVAMTIGKLFGLYIRKLRWTRELIRLESVFRS